MARFSRLEVLNKIIRIGLVPVFYHGDVEIVKKIVAACAAGGVDATEESIRAWSEAGVACVGIGSKLITRELVAAGDFEAITEKVQQVIGWIQQVHSEEA